MFKKEKPWRGRAVPCSPVSSGHWVGPWCSLQEAGSGWSPGEAAEPVRRGCGENRHRSRSGLSSAAGTGGQHAQLSCRCSGPPHGQGRPSLFSFPHLPPTWVFMEGISKWPALWFDPWGPLRSRCYHLTPFASRSWFGAPTGCYI